MRDKSTFISIIEEHEKILYKVVCFYMEHKEDREDLYQEIVLQLWKSFAKYKGESKIATWMYRVAMNTAISRLRKKKNELSSTSIEILNQTKTPLYAEEKDSRIKELYQQIETLSSIDKGLVLLYLESRTYEEMALVMGLSQTNVATKLSRIKQLLKKNMVNKIIEG